MTTARNSQFIGVAVIAEPAPRPQVSQLVAVAVVSGNIGYYTLNNTIALPCWSPCTAFGTQQSIYYLNGGHHK